MHFIFAIIGLLTTSALTAPQATSIDVHAAIKGLSLDSNGYVHIADDGVARSYDANGTVIDYVPLSNRQLMQYLDNAPAVYAGNMSHLHEIFDNVNGHDVLDKRQLVDPPAWLRQPAAGKRSASTPDLDFGLEPRQQYCLGRPCLTNSGCQFSGCNGCGYLDMVIPGGGGVCY